VDGMKLGSQPIVDRSISGYDPSDSTDR